MKEEKIKAELFYKGIESFEKHDFYDAHEHWEDLWSDYRLKDAKFIQALIQLAVGYFHITNNNKNGALGLFNKCIPKFNDYLPEYREINVIHILEQVDKTMKEINNIKELNKFNWSLVPNIRR